MYFKEMRRTITRWYTNGQQLQQHLQQYNYTWRQDSTQVDKDIQYNLVNIAQLKAQIDNSEPFATAKAFRTVVLTYKQLSDGNLYRNRTSTPANNTSTWLHTQQLLKQHNSQTVSESSYRTIHSVQHAQTETEQTMQTDQYIQTDTLNNTNTTDTQTETEQTIQTDQNIQTDTLNNTNTTDTQTDTTTADKCTETLPSNCKTVATFFRASQYNQHAQTYLTALQNSEQATQTCTETNETEVQTSVDHEASPFPTARDVKSITSDARKAWAWCSYMVDSNDYLQVTQRDDELYEEYTQIYGYEPYSRWLRNKHKQYGYEPFYYAITEFF
jgi:hypothetical protein